jgi:hypothetical protein
MGEAAMIGPFLLEEQFGLYEKCLESWRKAHQEAMSCRDIEDLVAHILTTLQQLRRRTETWAGQVGVGGPEFSCEDSKQQADLYHRWLAVASALVGVIEAYEQAGYEIEGAAELRTAHRDVSLMSLDPERAHTSIAALERGEGIPAQEVMDGIRHHLRP